MSNFIEKSRVNFIEIGKKEAQISIKWQNFIEKRAPFYRKRDFLVPDFYKMLGDFIEIGEKAMPHFYKIIADFIEIGEKLRKIHQFLCIF